MRVNLTPLISLASAEKLEVAQLKRYRVLFIVVFLALLLCARGAFASTPQKVHETYIVDRLQNMTTLLKGRYFTTTGKSCTTSYISGHGCSLCSFFNVCNNNTYIRANFSILPIDAHSIDMIHCRPNWKYVVQDCRSCAAFVNFAGWYLFAQKSTDNVEYYRFYDGYYDYDTMKHARPGDIIAASNHSGIAVQVYDYGIKKFDCNNTPKKYKNCYMQFCTTDYSARNRKTQVTISRAKNYDADNNIFLLDEIEYNGHKYRLYAGHVDWNTAKTYASNLGADWSLAAITSEDEQSIVQKMVSKSKRLCWLGGRYGSSGWEWVTGEQFEYAKWESGAPQNTIGEKMYLCLNGTTLDSSENKKSFSAIDGFWNHRAFFPLNALGGFVAEYSPDLHLKRTNQYNLVTPLLSGYIYEKPDIYAEKTQVNLTTPAHFLSSFSYLDERMVTWYAIPYHNGIAYMKSTDLNVLMTVNTIMLPDVTDDTGAIPLRVQCDFRNEQTTKDAILQVDIYANKQLSTPEYSAEVRSRETCFDFDGTQTLVDHGLPFGTYYLTVSVGLSGQAIFPITSMHPITVIPSDSDSGWREYTVLYANGLRIRQQPNTDSAIMDVMYANDRFFAYLPGVIQSDPYLWAPARFGDVVGYVAIGDSSLCMPYQEADIIWTRYRVVYSNGIKIRSYADSNDSGNIVEIIPQNAYVWVDLSNTAVEPKFGDTWAYAHTESGQYGWAIISDRDYTVRDDEENTIWTEYLVVYPSGINLRSAADAYDATNILARIQSGEVVYVDLSQTAIEPKFDEVWAYAHTADYLYGWVIISDADYTIPNATQSRYTLFNAASMEDGRQYALYKGKGTWQDASDFAASLGENWHLATITSADEQMLVDNMVSAYGGTCWLGGYYDGGWTWVTGEGFSYSNWDAGEPSSINGTTCTEPYIGIYGNSTQTSYATDKKWNDFKTTTSTINGFVAESSDAYYGDYDMFVDPRGLVCMLPNSQKQVAVAFLPEEAEYTIVSVCSSNDSVVSVSYDRSTRLLTLNAHTEGIVSVYDTVTAREICLVSVQNDITPVIRELQLDFEGAPLIAGQSVYMDSKVWGGEGVLTFHYTVYRDGLQAYTLTFEMCDYMYNLFTDYSTSPDEHYQLLFHEDVFDTAGEYYVELFVTDEAGRTSNIIRSNTVECESVLFDTSTFNNVLMLPAGLKIIQSQVFTASNIESVCCPEGLESIGEYAFADCSSLEALYVPDSVIWIADNALDNVDAWLVIYGKPNSYAEEYASMLGYRFYAQ